MKASVWLCVAGSIVVVGCGSSGKSPAANDNSSRAVAQALTTGADFDNGTVKSGGLPDTTANSVMVAADNQALTLAPSGTAIMSLDVDNPDESSDPVKATLIQFEDTDSHVEVPRMDADAGSGSSQTGTVHLADPFKVDSSICKDFCNKSFQVQMFMAVTLESGKISQHAMRSFTLDCSKDGDKTKCGGTDAGSTTKAGTGGSKSTSSKDASAPDNSIGEMLALGYTSYNMAVCGCNGGTASSYCGASDTYDMPTVACIKAAVNKAADSAGRNFKASCDLAAINTYVSSCKASCNCSFQGLGDALRADVSTSANCKMTIPGLDACMVKLGDAGMPKDAGSADAGAAPPKKDAGL